MSKLKTIKNIYDETFKQNYYMLIGVNRNRYVEIVKKELKQDVELPLANICGRTVYLDVEGHLIPIIWTTNKKPSNIAHECFHAIADVLEDRGVKLSGDSCEIYAYSLERLIRAALR